MVLTRSSKRKLESTDQNEFEAAQSEPKVQKLAHDMEEGDTDDYVNDDDDDGAGSGWYSFFTCCSKDVYIVWYGKITCANRSEKGKREPAMALLNGPRSLVLVERAA